MPDIRLFFSSNENEELMKLKKIGILMILGLLLSGCSSQNAIYSYKNKKVDANEYYAMLKEQYGTAFVYQYLEKEYFSSLSVEDSVMENIKKSSEELLTQNDNEENKKMIELSLRSFGYKGLDELELYMRNSYLRNKLIEEEFEKSFKDFDTFAKDYKPRIVTHILIKVDEEEVTLTDAIQAKMNEIDAQLKDTQDVKLAMLQLNDGNDILAENLGYVDKSSSLVESFLESALALNEGEVSNWVQSKYGYHRIYVESTQKETLLKELEFKESVIQSNPSLSVEIVLNSMKENGVEIETSLYQSFLEMAGL